jgi:hypothetical protein
LHIPVREVPTLRAALESLEQELLAKGLISPERNRQASGGTRP